MSRTASAIGLFSAIAIGVIPASALAKDRKPPPPPPCPVDSAILVASTEMTKRFSQLDACAGQVVENPATPDNYPHQGAITISSDGSDADGDAYGAGGIADSGSGSYGAGSYNASRNLGALAAGGKKDRHAVVMEKREEAGVRYTRIIPPEQPAESYYGATPYGVPVTPHYAPVPGTPVPNAPGGQGGASGLTIASSGAIAAGQAAPAANGQINDAAILSLRPRSYASQYDDLIEQSARRHGVDPLMLHAVIFQESRYKQGAKSHVGARGLMQIMPATGAGLGVRNSAHLYDPATNIDAGAKLLRQLWTKYNGRFDLVLAAYNAGPGAVAKYGQAVPPYRETRDYVVKVQGHYKRLANENGMTPTGF